MPSLFFSNLREQANLNLKVFTANEAKTGKTIRPENGKAWKVIQAAINHVNGTDSQLVVTDDTGQYVFLIGWIESTFPNGTYYCPAAPLPIAQQAGSASLATTANTANAQQPNLAPVDVYVTDNMHILYVGGGTTGFNQVTYLEWDNVRPTSTTAEKVRLDVPIPLLVKVIP